MTKGDVRPVYLLKILGLGHECYSEPLASGTSGILGGPDMVARCLRSITLEFDNFGVTSISSQCA